MLWESLDAEDVSGVTREHGGTRTSRMSPALRDVPTALAHVPTPHQRVPWGDATTVAHVALWAAGRDQDTPVPPRATLG